MKVQGQFFLPDGLFHAEVEIERSPTNLIIHAIKKIAATNSLPKKIFFPSFVDLHVHCRDDQSHKLSYKEDHLTASKAAINGGVGAFFDMPNTPIIPDSDLLYQQKVDVYKGIDFPILSYAAITEASTPLARKVPYKFFLSEAVGDLSVLEQYRNQWVSFHCELTQYFNSSDNHSIRRSELSEVRAIEKAIELGIRYQLRTNICHVSTKRGMQLIEAAKRNGVPVTAEVTFHHLIANRDNEGQDFRFQVNPPLRSQKDCEYLLESLENRSIDFLVSDHAPHLMKEKEARVSGIPMLDTYGPMAAELMANYRISASAIYQACCANPGRVFEEFSCCKMGQIEVGAEARFSLIDFTRPFILTKQNIASKCNWSPYLMCHFPATAKSIISMEDYERLDYHSGFI